MTRETMNEIRPYWVSYPCGKHAYGKKRTILGWMTEEELRMTGILPRLLESVGTPRQSIPGTWTGKYHSSHGGKEIILKKEISLFEKWKRFDSGRSLFKASDEREEKINIEDSGLF